MRGYTAFSEKRSPDEIFRVVNAYTTAVSRVVREHTGFVVEFQGDGLMAVFGAPRPNVHKERAAVEAALEVIDVIERGGVAELADHALQVGVGVATGPAYVGNVQSIDRKIWCVIGNTTNLAARLQALTRELGVSLLIDAATHERAGDAAAAFEASDVRVRGRSERMRVYAPSARERR
jgi:adenylate cyclase